MDRSTTLLGAYSWAALGLAVAFLRWPLSNVPGPWYSKFTGSVATYYWLTGQKPAYVHSLHLIYGPVVRVSPREVYIAAPDDVKSVFHIKNEYPKSKWYLDFVPFAETIFNTPDVEKHRRLRRLLSSPLSESGLKSFIPQIDSKVKLAIQRMREEQESRGVADIYKWWLFLTTDVIGELSFGESFRMLESGKLNQYASDLQIAGEMAAVRTAFPTLFRFIVVYALSVPPFTESRNVGLRMRNYALESIQRHRDIVARDGPDAQPTVFTKVWAAEKSDAITPEELRDNAQGYIIAGSDTTSNTLDYLVWAVCRHPEVQTKLNEELQALPDDFSYQDLRHLHYLDHVINEALRRYPVAPAGLPREVPPGGGQFSGYHIPAEYTVTTQSFTMHRNLIAFPDPEKFDPSRWENPTQEMKDCFMPFGNGSRICIGLNLAKIELRLAVARFFKAFPNARVSTREGMCDDDMTPGLYFLAGPQGHRCLVELY
ncbi:cytochrome P450 [Xylariaceae sp. FL0594]|nr:cytochrome P450 [Xylariaceae sp. FL0594]